MRYERYDRGLGARGGPGRQGEPGLRYRADRGWTNRYTGVMDDGPRYGRANAPGRTVPNFYGGRYGAEYFGGDSRGIPGGYYGRAPYVGRGALSRPELRELRRGRGRRG